jgi:hypothetical protein
LGKLDKAKVVAKADLAVDLVDLAAAREAGLVDLAAAREAGLVDLAVDLADPAVARVGSGREARGCASERSPFWIFHCESSGLH